MIKYRQYKVYKSGSGWRTSLPNDNNIYNSKEGAQNAIDTLLDCGLDGKNPRHREGVVIIGRKPIDKL